MKPITYKRKKWKKKLVELLILKCVWLTHNAWHSEKYQLHNPKAYGFARGGLPLESFLPTWKIKKMEDEAAGHMWRPHTHPQKKLAICLEDTTKLYLNKLSPRTCHPIQLIGFEFSIAK
jgi:hypothetical protein